MRGSFVSLCYVIHWPRMLYFQSSQPTWRLLRRDSNTTLNSDNELFTVSFNKTYQIEYRLIPPITSYDIGPWKVLCFPLLLVFRFWYCCCSSQIFLISIQIYFKLPNFFLNNLNNQDPIPTLYIHFQFIVSFYYYHYILLHYVTLYLLLHCISSILLVHKIIIIIFISYYDYIIISFFIGLCCTILFYIIKIFL